MENPLKRPLHVAFVDYVLEPDKPGATGLSDIVWDMASELVNQGHEAHVVASYKTDKYPDSRVHVHNFPTPIIGYRNAVGHFLILREAARIVKKLSPDIVHTPEYVSSAVLSTLNISCPIVMTVPGNVYQRIKEGHGFEWHYIQVLKWAANVSAKKCSSVIAISSEMKEWWERTGSHPNKTPMIPYGLNTRKFSHIPDARKKLGIQMDKQLMLYVGRFSKEKGIIDFLHSFGEVKRSNNSFNLAAVLIGEGPQRQEIESEIKRNELNGDIQVINWISKEELCLWYSAADALIMPSWYEPLGRVVFESMICNTPVIASNSGAPKDHIVHGKTGFVFPPHDVKALISILCEVNKDGGVLKGMRFEVGQYVAKNLTWEIITDRILSEVYYPLLRKDE